MKFYDHDGVPISAEQAEEMFHRGARRISRTCITDAADLSVNKHVSTVWLGVDHGLGLKVDEPPIIFETLVFPEQSALEEDGERYATLSEAREGHRRYVVQLAAACVDPVVTELEGEY